MLKLFYCPGSCSLVSHIALGEAGAEFEIERVDLSGDRTAYMRINPSGKVPALLADGALVTENVAILTLAARLHPEKKLLPDDLMAQVQAYSFLAWCASTAHIARRQFFAPARFTPDPVAHPALRKAGQDAYWKVLQQIDQRIGDNPWVGGDAFSVCDCYAMVFYDWGTRDGQDMDSLASFSRFAGRMKERPAVLTALQLHRSPLVERA